MAAETVPKGFKVPKIKRGESKDNLRTVDTESRDAKDVITIVEHSYVETKYKSQWQLTGLQFIENKHLNQAYREKRQEMRDDSKRDRELAEQYAFLLYRDSKIVPTVAKHGLYTRSLPFNALGDSKLGIYLCRNADVQLRLAEGWGIQSCTVILFKITMGKCKSIGGPGVTDGMEPTPNYDCHISQSPSPSDPIHIQLAKSQLYLYEYTDECVPSKRPRHCLPYAVLFYEKIETPVVSIPSTSKTEQSQATDSYNKKPNPLAQQDSKADPALKLLDPRLEVTETRDPRLAQGTSTLVPHLTDPRQKVAVSSPIQPQEPEYPPDTDLRPSVDPRLQNINPLEQIADPRLLDSQSAILESYIPSFGPSEEELREMQPEKEPLEETNTVSLPPLELPILELPIQPLDTRLRDPRLQKQEIPPVFHGRKHGSKSSRSSAKPKIQTVIDESTGKMKRKLSLNEYKRKVGVPVVTPKSQEATSEIATTSVAPSVKPNYYQDTITMTRTPQSSTARTESTPSIYSEYQSPQSYQGIYAGYQASQSKLPADPRIQQQMDSSKAASGAAQQSSTGNKIPADPRLQRNANSTQMVTGTTQQNIISAANPSDPRLRQQENLAHTNISNAKDHKPVDNKTPSDPRLRQSSTHAVSTAQQQKISSASQKSELIQQTESKPEEIDNSKEMFAELEQSIEMLEAHEIDKTVHESEDMLKALSELPDPDDVSQSPTHDAVDDPSIAAIINNLVEQNPEMSIITLAIKQLEEQPGMSEFTDSLKKALTDPETVKTLLALTGKQDGTEPVATPADTKSERKSVPKPSNSALTNTPDETKTTPVSDSSTSVKRKSSELSPMSLAMSKTLAELPDTKAKHLQDQHIDEMSSETKMETSVFRSEQVLNDAKKEVFKGEIFEPNKPVITKVGDSINRKVDNTSSSLIVPPKADTSLTQIIDINAIPLPLSVPKEVTLKTNKRTVQHASVEDESNKIKHESTKLVHRLNRSEPKEETHKTSKSHAQPEITSVKNSANKLKIESSISVSRKSRFDQRTSTSEFTEHHLEKSETSKNDGIEPKTVPLKVDSSKPTTRESKFDQPPKQFMYKTSEFDASQAEKSKHQHESLEHKTITMRPESSKAVTRKRRFDPPSETMSEATTSVFTASQSGVSELSQNNDPIPLKSKPVSPEVSAVECDPYEAASKSSSIQSETSLFKPRLLTLKAGATEIDHTKVLHKTSKLEPNASLSGHETVPSKADTPETNKTKRKSRFETESAALKRQTFSPASSTIMSEMPLSKTVTTEISEAKIVQAVSKVSPFKINKFKPTTFETSTFDPETGNLKLAIDKEQADSSKSIDLADESFAGESSVSPLERKFVPFHLAKPARIPYHLQTNQMKKEGVSPEKITQEITSPPSKDNSRTQPRKELSLKFLSMSNTVAEVPAPVDVDHRIGMNMPQLNKTDTPSGKHGLIKIETIDPMVSETVMLDIDHRKTEILSDTDHSKTEVLSDTDHRKPDRLSDTGHMTTGRLPDIDNRTTEIMLDIDHRTTERMSDTGHRKTERTSDKYRKKAQIISDTDHRKTERASDKDGTGHMTTGRLPDIDNRTTEIMLDIDHRTTERMSDTGHRTTERTSDKYRKKAQIISDTDHRKTERASDKDGTKAEIISDTDHRKTERLRATDHTKTGRILDSDRKKAQIVSDMDHRKAERASDKDWKKAEIMSDEDYRKTERLRDTDPTKTERTLDSDRKKANIVSDTDHRKAVTTSDKDWKKAEIISDKDHRKTERLRDTDSTITERMLDSDRKKANIVSDTDHRKAERMSDKYWKKAEIISDKDHRKTERLQDTDHIVTDTDHRKTEGILDTDHRKTEAVVVKDSRVTKVILDNDPWISRSTLLDRDHRVTGTVVEMDPMVTEADTDHRISKSVFDKDHRITGITQDKDLRLSETAILDKDNIISEATSVTGAILLKEHRVAETILDKDPHAIVTDTTLDVVNRAETWINKYNKGMATTLKKNTGIIKDTLEKDQDVATKPDVIKTIQKESELAQPTRKKIKQMQGVLSPLNVEEKLAEIYPSLYDKDERRSHSRSMSPVKNIIKQLGIGDVQKKSEPKDFSNHDDLSLDADKRQLLTEVCGQIENDQAKTASKVIRPASDDFTRNETDIKKKVSDKSTNEKTSIDPLYGDIKTHSQPETDKSRVEDVDLRQIPAENEFGDVDWRQAAAAEMGDVDLRSPPSSHHPIDMDVSPSVPEYVSSGPPPAFNVSSIPGLQEPSRKPDIYSYQTSGHTNIPQPQAYGQYQTGANQPPAPADSYRTQQAYNIYTTAHPPADILSYSSTGGPSPAYDQYRTADNIQPSMPYNYSTATASFDAYSTNQDTQSGGFNIQNVIKNLDMYNIKNILAKVQVPPPPAQNAPKPKDEKIPGIMEADNEDDDNQNMPAFVTGLQAHSTNLKKNRPTISRYSGIAIPLNRKEHGQWRKHEFKGPNIGGYPGGSPIKNRTGPGQNFGQGDGLGPSVSPVSPMHGGMGPDFGMGMPDPAILGTIMGTPPEIPLQRRMEGPFERGDGLAKPLGQTPFTTGENTDDMKQTLSGNMEQGESMKRTWQDDIFEPSKVDVSDIFAEKKFKMVDSGVEADASVPKMATLSDDKLSIKEEVDLEDEHYKKDKSKKSKSSPRKRSSHSLTPENKSWQTAILESMEQSELKVRHESDSDEEFPTQPVSKKSLFDSASTHDAEDDLGDPSAKRQRYVSSDGELEDDESFSLVIDLSRDDGKGTPASHLRKQDATPRSQVKAGSRIGLMEDTPVKKGHFVDTRGRTVLKTDDGEDLVDLTEEIESPTEEMSGGQTPTRDETSDYEPADDSQNERLEQEKEDYNELQIDDYITESSFKMKEELANRRKKMVINLKGEKKKVNPLTGKVYTDFGPPSSIPVLGQSHRPAITTQNVTKHQTIPVLGVHQKSRYRPSSPIQTHVSGISTIISHTTHVQSKNIHIIETLSSGSGMSTGQHDRPKPPYPLSPDIHASGRHHSSPGFQQRTPDHRSISGQSVSDHFMSIQEASASPIQNVSKGLQHTIPKIKTERKSSTGDVLEWFSDKFEPKKRSEYTSTPIKLEKVEPSLESGSTREFETKASYGDHSSHMTKRALDVSDELTGSKKQKTNVSDVFKHISDTSQNRQVRIVQTVPTLAETVPTAVETADTGANSELEEGEISDDSSVTSSPPRSENTRRVVVQEPAGSSIPVVGLSSSLSQRLNPLKSEPPPDSPKRIVQSVHQTQIMGHTSRLARQNWAANDWSTMLQSTRVVKKREKSPERSINSSGESTNKGGTRDTPVSTASNTVPKPVAKKHIKNIRTLEDWLRFELEVENIKPLEKYIPFPVTTDLSAIPKGRRTKIKMKVRSVIESESHRAENVEPVSVSPGTPGTTEITITLPDTYKQAEAAPSVKKVAPVEPSYNPEISGEQIEKEMKMVIKCHEFLRDGNLKVTVNPANNAPFIRMQQPGSPQERLLLLNLMAVECEMKNMLQRTCFYGYPHRRVPKELLFESEMGTFKSCEGDVFLILMMPISTKPYSKLVSMKLELESMQKGVTVAGEGKKQQIERQIKHLHIQRAGLLKSFTGFLNNKRITKLQDLANKYTTVYDYFKSQRPVTSDANLKFIRTTQMDLRQHLLLSKQYMVMDAGK